MIAAFVISFKKCQLGFYNLQLLQLMISQGSHKLTTRNPVFSDSRWMVNLFTFF